MDVFAPKEEMQIFGRGIRRRLAPMLKADRRRIELAFSLLLTLPGTPALVYGDEIGMGDDLAQKGRNAVRTGMQWSASRHGGFSSARAPKIPVISKGPFGYEKINAEAQQEEEDSLLNWMKRAIRERRCEEIGWGEWREVDVNNPAILAGIQDWMGKELITLHNLSDKPVQLDADLSVWKVAVVQPILASNGMSELRLPENHHLKLKLEPYGYCWLRPTRETTV